MEQNEKRQVGLESLRYHPSKVSWAMSQHISRENPKLHRVLVYLILTIVASVLLYSVFTKIALSVKATGKLDFDANTLTVINGNDLVVDRINFKDGDEVKKNDLLIVGKKQLSQELAKSILSDAENVQKNIQLEQQNKCSDSCLKNLELILNTKFSKSPKLDLESDLIDYLKQLSSELNTYLTNLKNKSSEPATLTGLKIRLTQATSKLNQIKRKKAQTILAMEVENLNKEVAEINAQIAEKKQGNTNQLSNARSTLLISIRALREKLITYRKNHEVRSPSDGFLKYETLGGEGELLSARTKIFKIIPNNSDLVARILIQNKDISSINIGDRVKVSIQALPEREFGSIYGKIKQIPINPIEDKETGSVNYEIIVELEKQKLISSTGEEKFFKLGMLLDAQIITKHKTLFWVGISKLLNIKEEYLGDLF